MQAGPITRVYPRRTAHQKPSLPTYNQKNKTLLLQMDLEFLPFNDSRINSTREAWGSDVSEGLAFPSEVERLLEWADTHREPTDIDGAAFGVFKKGSFAALGICEVIVQRRSVRSKWVKMLRLNLRPSVDDKLQTGHPESAMEVFVHAIIGSLDLQLLHNATTLKVYGRTNYQLNFLKALVTQIDQKVKYQNHVKATIDGRFLSIVVSP